MWLGNVNATNLDMHVFEEEEIVSDECLSFSHGKDERWSH